MQGQSREVKQRLGEILDVLNARPSRRRRGGGTSAAGSAGFGGAGRRGCGGGFGGRRGCGRSRGRGVRRRRRRGVRGGGSSVRSGFLCGAGSHLLLGSGIVVVAAIGRAGAVHPSTVNIPDFLIVLFTADEVAEKALRKVQCHVRALLALIDDLSHGRHPIVSYVDLFVAVGTPVPVNLGHRDDVLRVRVPTPTSAFAVRSVIIGESVSRAIAESERGVVGGGPVSVVSGGLVSDYRGYEK